MKLIKLLEKNGENLKDNKKKIIIQIEIVKIKVGIRHLRSILELKEKEI